MGRVGSVKSDPCPTLQCRVCSRRRRRTSRKRSCFDTARVVCRIVCARPCTMCWYALPAVSSRETLCASLHVTAFTVKPWRLGSLPDDDQLCRWHAWRVAIAKRHCSRRTDRRHRPVGQWQVATVADRVQTCPCPGTATDGGLVTCRCARVNRSR